MNKIILNFGIAALVACFGVSAEAKCCGSTCGSTRGCCPPKFVRVGGCCGNQQVCTVSSESVPGKVVPEDIQALPDSSILKQKYVKAFDLVPKSIKSWVRQSYAKRKTYLEGKMWASEKAKLEKNLARNTRMNREGYITAKDVVEMAEQMLVYGRALKFGGMADGDIRELANHYGFKKVSEFLKDTMDFKRYQKRGCAKVYPCDDPEFKCFDELMTAWHCNEWEEYRAKLVQLNNKYQENTQLAANAKKGRKRS